MKTCCEDIPQITCAVVDIQKRTEPIGYTNNILVINSSFSVEDQLSVGGATMSAQNNTPIDLPARTLINGVPLLSDAFRNDVISLPENTMIDGYFPITEQYYYFCTAKDGVSFARGYILNGEESFATRRSEIGDPRAFSFVAPEDCVLTSLQFLYTFQPTGTYSGTIASVLIDVLDTNYSVYYTGFYMDVPAPTSSTTDRVFAEKEFEYFVRKGDSVGVWVESRIVQLNTASAFAVLGFKVLPPQTSSLSYTSDMKSTLTNPYFPFHSIMNLFTNRPTNIHDQLAILRSAPSSSDIYGRTLTPQDFEERSQTSDVVVSHAEMAFFFSGNNPNRWYMDVSLSFKNTQLMESRYKWQGLQVGTDTILSLETLDQHNVPSVVDYLSFDISDPTTALGMLDSIAEIMVARCKFRFATIRHDLDQDIQFKSAHLFYTHQYIRIFTCLLLYPDQTCEDWYADPTQLDLAFLERISEHHHNHYLLSLPEAIRIIQDAI